MTYKSCVAQLLVDISKWEISEVAGLSPLMCKNIYSDNLSQTRLDLYPSQGEFGITNHEVVMGRVE